MRLRFSLRTLFITIACVGVAIAVPYWIPKRHVLGLNPAYVGYYRGLGLNDRPGYFGRNWFRVVTEEDMDGIWYEVNVNGLGYNEYRGYYGTGQVREEGLCLVEANMSYHGDDIAPNFHNLLHAKFYDPNGKLISEVKNKTGKQILCYPNGQPSWELDLLDGKYAHLKMWHDNGQLSHDEGYQDGEEHGVSVSYYPNGQLRARRTYANGKRIGIWVEYTEDGTLESETNYDNNGDRGS